MTRPRCKFYIGFSPRYTNFCPEGCGPDHDFVVISPEEAEALRLKNIKDLDQNQAAEKMGVSQSTFQRILTSAYKKVSEAVIYGKILKIAKDKV